MEQQGAGTVLVLGANGFIGGYLVAALRAHGWRVLRGVRGQGRALPDDARECDLMRLRSPDQWLPLLEGVDVVVNAAGILREVEGQSFQVIHHEAPLALAQACVGRGVRRFVQVSALGLPADGDFIATKHAFDASLQALPLSSVVLRPSLVYSATGSYGGTSLLRAMAAFPGVHLLPGDGRWPTQPLSTEDLGELVARAAGGSQQGVFEVGGPVPISLREYQQTWRRWLRVPGKRALHTPEPLVSAVVAGGEVLGRGPVGRTMWAMLRRHNVTAPDAADRLEAAFGLRPRSLQQALDAHPSQTQDRWQAQLYFLAPGLKVAVVLVFVLSALVGWLTPAQRIEAMTAGTALDVLAPVALARIGAGCDLLLALWLASGLRPRMAIGAMLALVGGYTLAFGLAVPALWLEPLGGLLKNLVLLPALAVLWVLAERR
ncbi:SDR family oxidoreductase [Pseudoxanthomonas sp.]|uniref:SDR family oxidoreductase n=1 Tax=Pseudoxanthomonas sp. TaxID=1871049 RepID=UPI00261860EB|nr:SDR family oxidoreductase [Pseudoxanthomonas sp.]WDS35732.1 MAG: SDR family oxidoreductase [Pseudoxanthomonas sp.]